MQFGLHSIAAAHFRARFVPILIRQYGSPRKDGSQALGHGLLETHRIRGTAQQRRLLNPGKKSSVPKEYRKDLTREVKQRLLAAPVRDGLAFSEVVTDIDARPQLSANWLSTWV